MRRFFTVLLGLFLSISLFAQGDVTKFLGIPVDGYKSEMRRKLEAKGFVWNSLLECLEGEFNGTDVQVHIVTNNNKVYRIMVRMRFIAVNIRLSSALTSYVHSLEITPNIPVLMMIRQSQMMKISLTKCRSMKSDMKQTFFKCLKI